MKKVLLFLPLLGLLAAVAWPPAAMGASKEIVQLQRDVALLQEQVRELHQSVERNNGALRMLLEQSLDAVNRMQNVVRGLAESVQEAQARTNARVDSLSTQIEAMRDTVDELRARLGQMSQQLSETRQVLESVDARLAAPPGAAPMQAATGRAPGQPRTTPPPVPSADVLYDSALRDFTSGNYDLARQEFNDYLKHYGRTQRAGNAQFYLGETFYHQGDFRRAIQEYDKVLEIYPRSYKVAAALLKKGYALLELSQRGEGLDVLQDLIDRFPRSDEARLARDRLKRLGRTASR